jgi:hypothetical protein
MCRKFRMIRFASALAIAAAIGCSMPGSAEAASTPDSQAPGVLFDKQDQSLIKVLEANFYGAGDRSHVLAPGPGGEIFNPGDPRDHLATPFVGSAASPVGGQHVRIEFGIAPKDDYSGGLRCILQSEGLATLATLAPDPSEAASGTWSKTIEIPNTVKQIRLVMIAANSKPTRLPSRIRISVDQAGMSAGMIAAIAGGVAVLGILAFVLLRKRAKAPVTA